MIPITVTNYIILLICIKAEGKKTGTQSLADLLTTYAQVTDASFLDEVKLKAKPRPSLREKREVAS